MTEEQLSKKITRVLPKGWTLRCISLARGSFIIDCPRASYYKLPAEAFAAKLETIGKVVDSQPVTTGAYAPDGGDEISTVFRLFSLKDPERLAHREALTHEEC